MKIAAVASNPSTAKAKTKNNMVMTHARFYEWLEFMNVADIVGFHNVYDRPTPRNRPLKKSEYELDRLRRDLEGYDVVIALGATAHDALDRIGIGHFILPHPSPRNRVLNDKDYVRITLQECRRFIHAQAKKQEEEEETEPQSIDREAQGTNEVEVGSTTHQGYS